MLRLVRERRGICSSRSAVAWGSSVALLQRRWCDFLAARPIASKALSARSRGCPFELAEAPPGCLEYLFERAFASLERTATDQRVPGDALQDRLELGEFVGR